jgi:hypothetical protein
MPTLFTVLRSIDLHFASGEALAAMGRKQIRDTVQRVHGQATEWVGGSAQEELIRSL